MGNNEMGRHGCRHPDICNSSIFPEFLVTVIYATKSAMIQTSIAARTSVNVSVKLSDHAQCLLVRIDFVCVVPQLAYLFVCVTHDARARSVSLRWHTDMHNKPLYILARQNIKQIYGQLDIN